MKNTFIRIKNGVYRHTDVSGRTFQLVEQFKQPISRVPGRNSHKG